MSRVARNDITSTQVRFALTRLAFHKVKTLKSLLLYVGFNTSYLATMVDGEEVEVTLPTPDTFPFPYPTPYAIQVDLMRTVFEAIEQKKIAIVSESPLTPRPPSSAKESRTVKSKLKCFRWNRQLELERV